MSEAFWDEEEGVFVWITPLRVYYDPDAGHFACRCQRYRDLGRCHHLTRWRPQVTVWALECYL